MRLLLVEDNVSLVELLLKGLVAANFEVDTVASVAEGIAALTTTRFSAIILDLGLIDGDGYSILQFLRGRGDSTPVLILTARGGVTDRVKGLRTGADDYLGKPFAFEELVARIEALVRRPSNLLGAPLRFGGVTFDPVAREVMVNGRVLFLSPREAGVLEILLRRGGRVVPKKLIEDQLYGLSEDPSSNAVEVYIHRLRSQLADVGANAEIRTIRGVGYLIQEMAS